MTRWYGVVWSVNTGPWGRSINFHMYRDGWMHCCALTPVRTPCMLIVFGQQLFFFQTPPLPLGSNQAYPMCRNFYSSTSDNWYCWALGSNGNQLLTQHFNYVDQANSFANSCWSTHPVTMLQGNIMVHHGHVCGHLFESPMVSLTLALFWPLPTPEDYIWLLLLIGPFGSPDNPRRCQFASWCWREVWI